MINVLFPLAGKSNFFPENKYPFPKPLIEINDKMMIEIVIENYKNINEVNFIFVISENDCKKFHLDNTLNLLTDGNCQIVKLQNETKGAACSALMAIEYIDNDVPLIIANADQVFEEDLEKVIRSFEEYDGGVITFESAHPRWSYVKVDRNSFVVEASEKKPISKKAVAGFYYFRKGGDFIESAMSMIEKDANVNGFYYIAPSLNEMILRHKKLTTFFIEKDKYFTFYMPQKMEEYKRKF
jgi:dTDP-glucose pyrophosphorylase